MKNYKENQMILKMFIKSSVQDTMQSEYYLGTKVNILRKLTRPFYQFISLKIYIKTYLMLHLEIVILDIKKKKKWSEQLISIQTSFPVRIHNPELGQNEVFSE